MSGFQFIETKKVAASDVGTLTMEDLRDPTSNLPLDWTRIGQECEDEKDAVRLPIDVVEEDAFDPTDDHLAIIGTSGKKVTKIGGLGAPLKFKIICLRSHLIEKMEGLEGHSETLEELELYDNQVGALEQLEHMPKLTNLDISFNAIRNMASVSNCKLLTTLYIANNKLTSIEGLEELTQLKTLDVGANRLRSMKGIGGLVNLEHLWMGKNKITEISDLQNLKKLRRLDIQSNRLTKVENLENQIDCLEELYLASNGIDDEGLAPETGVLLNFQKLNVLDFSKNQIAKLSHFSHLTSLDELWIAENDVSFFSEVEALTPNNLDCVYLEHNPIAKDHDYRKKLKNLLPSLTQIDANAVGQEGRGMVGGGFSNNGSVAGYGMAAMTDEQRVKVMRILQQQALQKAKVEAEKNSTKPAATTMGPAPPP
ncbi:hypothetical protein TrLO_g3606 [Triparma laevis f. longispina]|uniref:Protein phosphatase 1 regulatory subunit 7 n=1 Tax=Triparma laevis f. longispina TaxID=1714387 RepID=A0A9W7EHT3_9STRA|nr:hypothetical protein TrLO_g3606 [Triparma laevis f. longispina]